MSKSVITWPTQEEKSQILNDFENMGFKDVLGVIDGTHVRNDTSTEDPESYYNRKKFHSVHVQGICDSNKKRLDILLGFQALCMTAAYSGTLQLKKFGREMCR
ncbi:hypothetical protein JTB14_011593 [Gonioctena quinquepunctata]|nr:hypothetical protein JTB14_011593 [Gonioctena quinquepunctata]